MRRFADVSGYWEMYLFGILSGAGVMLGLEAVWEMIRARRRRHRDASW